jgi:hypothetical protein
MAADVAPRLEQRDFMFRMQMMRGSQARDTATDNGNFHAVSRLSV